MLTEELLLERLQLSSRIGLRDIRIEHSTGTVNLIVEDPHAIVPEGQLPPVEYLPADWSPWTGNKKGDGMATIPQEKTDRAIEAFEQLFKEDTEIRARQLQPDVTKALGDALKALRDEIRGVVPQRQRNGEE